MVIRTLFVVVFVCYFMPCVAQYEAYESRQNDPQSAINSQNKADIYLNLGQSCVERSLDSAQYYAQKSLSLIEETSQSPIQTKYFVLMGDIATRKGKIVEALKHYNKGYLLASQLNDAKQQANCLVKMGAVYQAQKKYAKALGYYTENLSISKALKNTLSLLEAYTLVATCYKEMGQHEGIVFAEKAAEMAIKSQNEPYFYLNLSIIARLYVHENKIDTAIVLADKALVFAQKRKDTLLSIDIYRTLARAFAVQNKHYVALNYAQKAFDIANKAQLLQQKSDALKLLSQIYAKVGGFKNAYMGYVQHKAIEDTLFNRNTEQQIAALENENKINENQLLKQQKLKQQDELKNRKIIIIAISIFLAIGTVVLLQLIRKNKIINLTNFLLKQNNKAIEAQEIELRVRNISIETQKNRLEKQTDELKSSNMVKDKMLSIIAHDLRNPLFALQQLLEMYQEGDFSIEQIAELIPKIITDVTQINNLLVNLLEWAKQQISNTSVHKEVFLLKDIVIETIELLEIQANKKNILLIDQTPHNLNPEVLADKEMLKLVVRNLLSNAIKFSNAESMVSVLILEQASCVEVQIADTGTGISTANLSKIFSEINFTTRGTNKEKGTGLGLMICKEFVEKNGGTIALQSEFGKGTLATFTIPKSV